MNRIYVYSKWTESVVSKMVMRLENGQTRGKEDGVLPFHIRVLPQTSAGDIWAAHTQEIIWELN